MEGKSPDKAARLGGTYGKTGDTEKRFVQLSPDSVTAAAESIGINNLASNVSRALAEDATYRVREVASFCSLLLKHSKKRKLSVRDMNRALAWCGVAPVLGQGGGGEVSPGQLFHYLPEGELFVERDSEVDLVEDALGPGWQGAPPPALEVTASWLAVEGAALPGGEAVQLSPALAQYYSALVSCLLGDSEDLCSTILKDVRTNPKLAPLIPYLVTFIRQGMKRHPNKPKLNTRILRLLSSLFSNPHLNLSPKPYLSHLVTALLTTILSPEPSSSSLTPLCASILALALSRWATAVNQLQVQTLRHLREFLGPDRSSGPHRAAQYGALTTLTMLGPEVLCETPWPGHLCRELEGRHQEPLWGALRRAGALRLNHMLEQTEHCTPDLRLYGDLYVIFGDSLLPEVRPLDPQVCSGGVRPVEVPGRLRLRKVRLLGRRQEPRQAREPRDQLFTASQNFDFLADMPSDIFETEMEIDPRLPEASGRGSGRQPSYSMGARVREVFPGSQGPVGATVHCVFEVKLVKI